MSVSSRGVYYEYGEYVRFEEASVVRHEYLDGEIRAIGAATPNESALAADVLATIAQQLPRGCRAFSCNLRVRIPSKNVATYADGAVVCGAVVRAEDDHDAITNPLFLAEVTSNATESYDRNRKLDFYRTISSLQEVLIVSHQEPRLTVHRRRPDGWTTEEARAGEVVRLESVRATLAVDEIYRDPLP